MVIANRPVEGAVHVHQTEWPPMFPAWFGSPASLVAPTFEPATLTVDPTIPERFTKSSLPGLFVTMKLVALSAVPSCVTTENIPVTAFAGMVAKIWLSEKTVKPQSVPLMSTCVVLRKPAPLMVTMVPGLPLAGVNPVTDGLSVFLAQLRATLPPAPLNPSTAT